MYLYRILVVLLATFFTELSAKPLSEDSEMLFWNEFSLVNKSLFIKDYKEIKKSIKHLNILAANLDSSLANGALFRLQFKFLMNTGTSDEIELLFDSQSHVLRKKDFDYLELLSLYSTFLIQTNQTEKLNLILEKVQKENSDKSRMYLSTLKAYASPSKQAIEELESLCETSNCDFELYYLTRFRCLIKVGEYKKLKVESLSVLDRLISNGLMSENTSFPNVVLAYLIASLKIDDTDVSELLIKLNQSTVKGSFLEFRVKKIIDFSTLLTEE